MAKLQKKVYICVKVVFCVKIIWWNWLDYMEEKTGRALKWFYMIRNCVVPFFRQKLEGLLCIRQLYLIWMEHY